MNRTIPNPTARIGTPLRVFAWLSFFAEITIIGTGGAVRLTGSGLGCPTWPTCTADSLVPTPEMGVHGIIEFANRTMTGVVGIIALVVFVLVWRIRRERRDLFALAFIVGVGIVAQAVVGGITVWTGLNPFIVGFHYLSSLALVCVTAAFLVRMHQQPGVRERAVPAWYATLAHTTSAVLGISLVFGVLTTGAGPHSGDVDAGRSGFDAEILEHVHAWPGYLLVALTIALVVGAIARQLPTRNWACALLGIEVVQVAVGLYQARNGLPTFAVGVHMVLAALTAAAMVVVVLRLTRPAAQVNAHLTVETNTSIASR